MMKTTSPLIAEPKPSQAAPDGDLQILQDAWRRLGPLCQRLWDADSPAAVELQAVFEEFRGGVHRAEQMFARLHRLCDEVRATVTKELEQRHRQELEQLVLEFKAVQERDANHCVVLAQKEERIQELIRELESKEATNFEFHDRFLKSSAEQDESRAKKMEGFYLALVEKERAAEARWETRLAQLETEHAQRSEELKGRTAKLHEELSARAAALEEQYGRSQLELEQQRLQLRQERQAWEEARLHETQALAKRKDELTLQADALASDYKKKQAELQRIKESLQAELGEVVRQYQSRMRGSGA